MSSTITGTLHLVATPIGNLEDITLRALRILREVSLIAAEDTRHTGKLLAHFGIQTPVISYHEHNHRSRRDPLLARLQGGENLALVTDAGTPGVSDPGAELVRACLARQIKVSAVPGASAMLAAAVASGFPLAPFTFLGFAPSRAKARSDWVARVAETAHTVCFFESPHRILTTLRELCGVLGKRQMVVARELTKIHEEIISGSSSDICEMISHPPRGEFTVVVAPREEAIHPSPAVTDQQVADEFGHMADSREFATRRELISALAKKHGRSARDVYRVVLSHRNQE